MKGPTKIPGVNYVNQDNKTFEFRIMSNRDILTDDLEDDAPPFRPHRLHFYAIMFILEGEGKHFIDFKSYDYKKGSIIFISKEQVQAFQQNKNREAYFLIFTDNFLERASLGSSLMQHLSLYNYHLYPPVINLKEKEMDLFTDLVLRIKNEYHGPDDNLTEEIIHSSLKIFLCMAERIRKKNRKEETISGYQEEYLAFQKLLTKHLAESRKVEFYATLLNISSKKLNRITKEIMNQSTKSYINEMLIIEIKRQLMNTSYNIKEICFRVGFDDPTNFVKFFKKHVGMTPSQFRRQY